MGKPILYGNIINPPVRTVLLTAAAVNFNYEYREIDVLEKKNPQHTIPTLEIDGKLLSDSHAIATYLVGKYGKDDSLYPKDLFERALVDQRLHFNTGILYPRLQVIYDRVINREFSTKQFIDAIYEVYDLLEKFLNGTDYVATNNLTIADFSCMATVSSLRLLSPLSTERYPNILAWTKRMESLPYYEEKCGRGARVMQDIMEKIVAEYRWNITH